MDHKPPSIRDIAREAGVSISAVSHAFNRPGELSPDVRDRILRLAHERGYRPDPRARGLRRDESRLVALITTDLGNGFFAGLAAAVQQAVASQGYYLVVLAGSTADDERRSLEAVYHERMVGAIVPAYKLPSAELSRHAKGRPVVFIADSSDTFAGPLVCIDNFAAAYTATGYLARGGRRRIAHITGPLTVAPACRRAAGYRRAVEELEVGPPLEAGGDFTFASGRRAMDELLALPEPPDAVFACNDMMAVGALRALQARGIAVPDDVAVVGFDNSPESAWCNPELTTMDQSIARLGAIAARLLLARLRDPSYIEKVEVSCDLILRCSA